MSKEFELPKLIDLHGFTVQAGYNRTLMFIRLSALAGRRHCKVVTGISGKMRREFEKWMGTQVFKPYVESFKVFDNQGSFIITLRKKS
jgi:DNA-nicking Smr family endonuclease